MIVAIDPGITGAIAWFNGPDLKVIDDMPVETVKIGKTKRSRIVPERLVDMLDSPYVDMVVLELVTAQGRNGSLGNFGLGRSFGVIETAIAAFGHELTVVTPRVWKGALGLDSDKSASLDLARSLWPDRTYFTRAKDDGRAEAALIGHWYLTHGEITP